VPGIAEGAHPLPVFRRRNECAGRRTVAVTMRTPGADFELAAGFLYGEGIIRSGDEIRGISHCEEPDLDEDKRYNILGTRGVEGPRGREALVRVLGRCEIVRPRSWRWPGRRRGSRRRTP
jgi:hypothetical protein